MTRMNCGFFSIPYILHNRVKFAFGLFLSFHQFCTSHPFLNEVDLGKKGLEISSRNITPLEFSIDNNSIYLNQFPINTDSIKALFALVSLITRALDSTVAINHSIFLNEWISVKNTFVMYRSNKCLWTPIHGLQPYLFTNYYCSDYVSFLKARQNFLIHFCIHFMNLESR